MAFQNLSICGTIKTWLPVDMVIALTDREIFWATVYINKNGRERCESEGTPGSYEDNGCLIIALDTWRCLQEYQYINLQDYIKKNHSPQSSERHQHVVGIIWNTNRCRFINTMNNNSTVNNTAYTQAQCSKNIRKTTCPKRPIVCCYTFLI